MVTKDRNFGLLAFEKVFHFYWAYFLKGDLISSADADFKEALD